MNQATQPKMTLRESEQELDESASSLDKSTDLTARETLQIFARTTYFFKFFKARIAAKLGFITLEHTFRLLIIPWPLKIIVDHVILGQPIPANGSGFPSYLGFVMPYLSTLGVTELMLWMLTLGVLMVVLFGMTPNRATGRHANGAYTGAALDPWEMRLPFWLTAMTPQRELKTRRIALRARWAEFSAYLISRYICVYPNPSIIYYEPN